MLRRFGTILLTLFALLTFSSRAFAQSWSFDARTIGMGGVGSGNLATKMIDSERNYTSIVIPIGLFQVLSDTAVFDPNMLPRHMPTSLVAARRAIPARRRSSTTCGTRT
jgi:hypothetical protein